MHAIRQGWISQTSRVKHGYTTLFWRTGWLQRPIQGRTTPPRRRQRHHKDRRTNRLCSGQGKTWPDDPRYPMLNSGHRGLHGHGHLHQGLGSSHLVSNGCVSSSSEWCRPCVEPVLMVSSLSWASCTCGVWQEWIDVLACWCSMHVAETSRIA